MDTALVSRLRIDNSFRIILLDYGGKEVKLTPLPKALFLLFLNHPEGILLKNLPLYRKEIASIYMHITHFENMEAIDASIDDLLNVRKNSIHEKCSRIKAAFLAVVPPQFLNLYIVSGERGAVKRILLDRSLVEFKPLE